LLSRCLVLNEIPMFDKELHSSSERCQPRIQFTGSPMLENRP
jgi:hypothetical protein